MVYGLKEDEYTIGWRGRMHIWPHLPEHITLVATPDERVWRIERYYCAILGDPITIT